MHFKKKKKVQEFIDKDLNLISGSELDTQTEITSYMTTDDSIKARRQPTGPFYYSSSGYIKEDGVIENILTKEVESELKEIPSLDYLKKYPIILKNLEVLIDSIKRKTPDYVADLVVISEVINSLDIMSIPKQFKNIIKNKLSIGIGDDSIRKDTL